MASFQRRKVVLAQKKKAGETKYVCQVEEGMFNLTDDVSLATDFLTATQAHRWMHRYGNNQFLISEAILPLKPMWLINEL